MEGNWSGLSLQIAGDQILEVESCGVHYVENESRKSVPSGVYMLTYLFFVADYFSGVLGQARNA